MSKIYDTLRSFGRARLLDVMGAFAKPAPYVYILGGHMADWHHDNQSDGERFGRMLKELSKYCDFVNFQKAVELIESGEKVKRATVAFTFDDGWRDCYTQIAPQLEKYGVNAIFFINPNAADAVDNNDTEYLRKFTDEATICPGKVPMGWAQLKELKERGFLIGAHTMDHFLTAKDDHKELEYQILECKKVIEKRLGGTCDYFAWPYGRLEHTSDYAVELASKTYKNVFSQSNDRRYFSCDGKVINRRHFEPFWPVNHVKFFLSLSRF